MLTDRDNALRILRFAHPERVTGGLPCYGLTYHGCNHEGYAGGGHDCPVGSRWTDIWGTGWHKEHAEVMGFPRETPLADPAALPGYEWPDPDDPRICGTIYDLARGYVPGDDHFLAGQHRDTLWEKAYMLVGMENMMAYLYTEPDYAREVLHRIMDFQLGIAAHYLACGVEVVNCGDDLGTQCAALLNPAIVEEFFLPEYARLFSLYKAHGVLINFHSCGHIEPFLESFIALGIDILNPIQATANDLARVREITAGRLTLQGGVSTAIIMAGPVEAIEAEVRRCLWLLGRDGGYFCGPDQGMPFPPAHIAAVWRAVEEYGVYNRMTGPIR
jgi:uroporphyrinogen decarboxylase